MQAKIVLGRMIPLLCTIIAVNAWGVKAAEPEVVHRWVFHTDDDAKEWRIGQQIKNMAVVNGRLRMTISGKDAFLFAPNIRMPLDGCMVRIRLRGDHDGYTQVYWQTSEEPVFSEQRQITINTAGKSFSTVGVGGVQEFMTLDYALGGPGDIGRELTALRIDPFNNSDEGIVEIESVELLVMPPAWEASLSTVNHLVPVGTEASTRLILRQKGGRAMPHRCSFDLPGGKEREVEVGPTTPAFATEPICLSRAGVHRITSFVKAATSQPAYNLETSVIAGGNDSLPLVPGIGNERIRLDWIPMAEGGRIGAGRWQVRDGNHKWKPAGWLFPLVELVVQQPDGNVIKRRPEMALSGQNGRSSARLVGHLPDLPGWSVVFEIGIDVKSERPGLAVKAELSGPENGKLLDFSAPVLLVDRESWAERVGPGVATKPNDSASAGDWLLDRFALFGGLEFLEPHWRSSSDRAVGRKFADRWAPHPFKITLPMMAIEAKGLTTAMMWQPLDPWDGTETMPTAVFASPNFLDGQSNHLMKIAVPSIPKWRAENALAASTPYLMAKERPVTIRAVLYGEDNLPVAMAARRWYEWFGTPAKPPSICDDRKAYDLLARHYGETMYWPEEKGWRQYWYLGKTSEFVPFMAAELVSHARQTGQIQWIHKTGIVDRKIIDTIVPLGRRLGHSDSARAAIAAMRPDGTWPFVNSPAIREQTRQVTNGMYDSLGEDNSTSLGTCVQPALAILHYALLTGGREYIEASMKALESMRQFRVPRGAQVWEVHQEIPDIRATALAVEAYHIGYQLTGDRRYLQDASYWAWAGVPFAYSWHVPAERTPPTLVATRDRDDWSRSALPLAEACTNPDRQVTPFGTVPVLGPTFYMINWYGVIVQWCGLEWAWKVIELNRDLPDPLLKYIADGVVLSGQQQTFDRSPWTGLYPDVWDLQTNAAQGAFISAMLPMTCMQAQGRLPAWSKSWTRVLAAREGGQRWHVSGWGRPVELTSPHAETVWSAVVEYLSGEPNELVLAPVLKPHRIHVEEEPLENRPSDQVGSTVPGWYYEPGVSAVVMRFIQKQMNTRVRIDW